MRIRAVRINYFTWAITICIRINWIKKCEDNLWGARYKIVKVKIRKVFRKGAYNIYKHNQYIKRISHFMGT